MTNRTIAFIVKEQTPIKLKSGETLQRACRLMAEKHVGSVLIVDDADRLIGIFTGRDAVRAVSKGLDPATTVLASAMTRDPLTIEPSKRSIDALRLMWDGGFRHLPVVEGGSIRGVVSRGDFKGVEIDRLDLEQHLWESIR